VLHTAASSSTGLSAELTLLGDNVIQNNCTLYSCRIEQGVYVGHNSVIMEGAILQKGAIIAPNSVVPPGRVVKERQVWGGNPIKYIRSAKEQEGFVTLDYARYVNEYAQNYNNSFLPYNNAYLYRHGTEEVIICIVSPFKSISL
jgi:carbonic anhydrase/acetyltransferase-like protein (isoleucine patch superfamily)